MLRDRLSASTAPANAPLTQAERGFVRAPALRALEQRRANRLLVGYVATASVLLHVLCAPVWVLWLARRSVYEAPAIKAACADLDRQQMALVRRECRDPVHCPVDKPLEVALLEEEPPPEPEKREPPEEDIEAFVVTPPDVEETEPPDEDVDAFGATINTRVEQQMAAKADHYGMDSGPPAPREVVPAPQPRRPVEVPKPRAEPQPEQASARPVPQIEEPDVQSKQGESKQGDAEQEAVQLSPSEEAPSLDQLMPDFDQERMAAVTAPGGGTVDYLKDVDEGERTLLNRKRVSYADFFERVKLGVATHWNPAGVYRKRDPTGRIYGVEDRLTVLNVTLRGDGTLAELYVERPSGLDFLDDEAMRAMYAAVPFPNPPEGLKDLNGLVHFRFAFEFEISTRRFRMFRYR